MMKLDPELQAAVINLALDEFAEELETVLREKLKEKSGNVPSVTIKNLSTRLITAQATSLTAKHQLFFQDSGRHVDRKRQAPGKPSPFDKILDWAKRRGIQSFKFVPGYGGNKPGKLEEAKQIERIASAIAFARAKGFRKKAKQQKLQAWINSNFYREMNQFLRNIQGKQAEYLKTAFANEFHDAMGKIEL